MKKALDLRLGPTVPRQPKLEAGTVLLLSETTKKEYKGDNVPAWKLVPTVRN